LAGLQKSDLIILAARPSFGKSALALDFARNVATLHKIPVGIFSLEMSKDQIIDRVISAQTSIDLWRLRTGRLSDDRENNDFEKIKRAMGILAEAPIFIDDSSGSNILQMRAMARRLQADKGLGLLIIDYLQLMEPRNPSLSMVQQVTENSKSLKSLAKELNIPVLAISQLSRAVEQRTPQIPRLADLRESGSLEQDADVVLFIYREDRYKENSEKKNIADIIIAKHRNGPVGKIQLYFDEPIVSFRNVEKSYSDDNEELDELNYS
jgi:replicative DNA helicase